MNEERDFVTFTDDDGNDFELDVIEYFEHNGKEYAVLIDADAECGCDDDDCDCEHETTAYIMQVVVNEEDDTEEFISPADEEMEELVAIVEELLAGGCGCGCGDDCDCEECEDDCDCDCEDGCDCKN